MQKHVAYCHARPVHNQCRQLLLRNIHIEAQRLFIEKVGKYNFMLRGYFPKKEEENRETIVCTQMLPLCIASIRLCV